MADLVAQAGHSSERFRKKMDKLNVSVSFELGLLLLVERGSYHHAPSHGVQQMFMRDRHLPKDLQLRIRNYFVNIIQRRGGMDDHNILGTLPSTLKSECVAFMNKDIIEKVGRSQQSPGHVTYVHGPASHRCSKTLPARPSTTPW